MSKTPVDYVIVIGGGADMRLWGRLTLLLVALLLIGAYIQPEYKIHSIFSGSGGNTRETELLVIVYKPWDTDGTVSRIVKQHNKMNGTPNWLTMHLYHSQYALNHGRAYYTVTFEYNENEVTPVPKAW